MGGRGLDRHDKIDCPWSTAAPLAGSSAGNPEEPQDIMRRGGGLQGATETPLSLAAGWSGILWS